MKKVILPAIFMFLILNSTFSFAQRDYDILKDYPHVSISNGIIDTNVFLPDDEQGFYRSSRYEWSGMLWQLTYKNHKYFMYRKAQIPHNPEETGDGMSLAEEFSIGTNKHIPQRFNEAKPGETFMKIGTGNLIKPDDGKPYAFSAKYEISDNGKWKIKKGKHWIEFTHELKDSYGFGYKYIKKMELLKNKPVLVISHELKNTGEKNILADQYCHNFFTMDYHDIGPDYEIELFFPAKFKNNMSKVSTIENDTIKILNTLTNGIFSVMEGFSDNVKDNHCIIRNTATKTAVDIKGDFPLGGFNFYADQSSICPEFFINLDIPPGKSKSWKRTYTFIAE